jgi:integrase
MTVVHKPIALGGNCAIVPHQANTVALSLQEMERMARRRHQNPKPVREGLWWYLRVWEYSFVAGKQVRKLKPIKLAEASKKEREVKKIADEIVRPINHGQITVGAAVNFGEYVKDNGTYMTAALSLLPKAVKKCYKGVIHKYLNPEFANTSLAEISLLRTQAFFAELPGRGVAYPTIIKIRDVFSHVLRSAVKFRYLTENPMKGLELPADPRGVIEKPFIYPHQFEALLELIPEPYATMLYVAVWTGLRVSELAGLKWHNIEPNSISVERRYCRGEWRAPKTNASAARVAASDDVLARIHRLKTLEVEINWGGQAAKKKFKVVRSDGPDDLVFQSLKAGKPMNDGNILKRFIKPAAKALKLGRVNWRSLRTSCATWMVRGGADPKSVQGQMRHSRISTTLEIYAQFVPEGQRQAVEQMKEYAKRNVLEAGTKPGTVLVQ